MLSTASGYVDSQNPEENDATVLKNYNEGSCNDHSQAKCSINSMHLHLSNSCECLNLKNSIYLSM